MKNLLKLNGLLYVAFLSILFISTYACSDEQVTPNPTIQNEDLKITFRTSHNCTTDCAGHAKTLVSERDNIPLSEILTSYYSGQTAQGYCVYQLITQYNGTKFYTVTGIIGDDHEGF